MNKIETFEYILSVILFLLYLVVSWQFFMHDDIRAGIESIIFLLCIVELRRIRGERCNTK